MTRKLVGVVAVLGLLAGSAVAVPRPVMPATGGVRAVRPPTWGDASILFEGGPGLDSGLYATDARGQELRVVVGQAGWGEWSPDGKVLAFSRGVGQRVGPGFFQAHELDLMRMSDAQVVRVVTSRNWNPYWPPSFSPDGTRLALVEDPTVVTIGLDGRHRRVLATGTMPSWSPDGRHIALLRRAGTRSGLFVINSDGTGERELAPGLSADSSTPVSWSPDGTRLAFTVCCPTAGIAVVALKARKVRRLSGSKVSWSPDGKWLALGGGGTFVARPDGSGRRKLSTLDGGWGFDPPAWSPDSKAVTIGVSGDVWVIPLHGRARRLTQGWRYGYSNSRPVWNPAGLPLAALRGREVSAANVTDTVVQGSTLLTTHPVDALAADGNLVAINYEDDLGVGPRASEVWNPSGRSLVRFRFASNRAGVQPSALIRIALAGDRVVWSYGTSGAGQDGYGLITATTAVPRLEGVRDSSLTTNDPHADLIGQGTLVVADSWRSCRLSLGSCHPGPKVNGMLLRLDGTQATPIATSAGALTPLSVDAGRILVDHEDGTLDIRDASGTVLRTFTFNGPLVRGARLQGRDLVVQTPTALEITDSDTGIFQRRWTLPTPDATLADLQNGIALLTAGPDIHLLRLTDGADAVIHTPSQGPLLAQLEPSGLVYAYTVADHDHPGRVVYVAYDSLALH